MREKELIVYRNMSSREGKLLSDMSFLMDHYNDAYNDISKDVSNGASDGVSNQASSHASGRREKMKELFYGCIHELLEMAGTHGV